jgi:hypothetical protein
VSPVKELDPMMCNPTPTFSPSGAQCLRPLPREHALILEKIGELYRDLFRHDGFGELKVTMRFLKRGQKEVVIACGKEFRFVVDYPGDPAR